MKANLRRVLAMVMATLMILSCMPLTAMAEIIEASGAVQPGVALFTIDDGSSYKYITYTFVNGEETVSTQIVKTGDTLYAPASPEMEGYKFLGWYEGDTAFTGFDVQADVSETKDVTLTAKFAEVHYVFFMDKEGRVYATKEGIKDDVIAADVTFPVSAEEGITGWYTEASLTNKVNSVTLETQNVTLWPKVETGHWITFDSNDGSYIEPVFVLPGKTTAKPAEPTRPGYTFAGWYNGESEFAFGGKLTDSVTLTAHWTANTDTPYTVIHWLENANDNGYSYNFSETKTGTTGTKTAVVAKTYKEDNYTTFTALTDGSGNLVDPDGNPAQKAIEGDGSTIVNVYYAREKFTVTFYSKQDVTSIVEKEQLICGKEAHEHSIWSGCYRYNGSLKCTKTEHTHVDTCYKTVEVEETTREWVAFKTVLAKHGANIKTEWPGGNWSTTQKGGPYQAFIETMPIGGDEFWWKSDSEVGTTPDEGDQSVSKAHYMIEVLDGETGSRTFHNMSFNEHHKDVLFGTEWRISKEDFYDITGFSQYKYVNGDGTVRDKGVYPNQDNPYNGSYFYYTRNDYKVIYYNGSSIVNEATYQYEANISGAKAFTPDRPEGIPAEYSFAGWYDNPEGVGESFNFNRTMPADNITVYAKWTAPTYEAKAFKLITGGDYVAQEIAYGETIDESKLPKVNVPEGYAWRGWCVRTGNEGNYVYTPFNFNTRITSDIELYPYYTSTQSFGVSYLLNGGTGTAPTDSRKYAEGSYADIQAPTGVTAPEGQVFLYWNTQADGSGTSYYPGDKMSIPAGNVLLYAIYGSQAAAVTLTYHSDFDTDVTKAYNTLQNNEQVTVLAYSETVLPERDGYECIGWATESKATTPKFYAGTKVRVDNIGSNDLYAVWKKTKFTVSYTYSEGAPAGAPPVPTTTKHEVRSTVSVATVPSVPGYTFSGWSADGITVENGSFAMPEKDVKFTGAWTKRTDLGYTVNYYKDSVADGNLLSSDSDKGTFEATIPYTDGKYLPVGYVTPGEVSGQTTITAVEADNVLNVVYSKNNNLGYTVNYYKDSVADGNLLGSDNGTGTFGDAISHTNGKYLPDGYVTPGVVSGQETITAVEANNVLNVVYSKSTKLSYTVNYMWGDQLLDTKSVGNQTFEAKSPVEAPRYDITGYTPVSDETKSITIGANSDENVITFYYYKNVTIVANSDTKVYNGQLWTVDGYTCKDGDVQVTFDDTITATGSGIDVDEYPVEFDDDYTGTIDTSKLYRVASQEDGLLTITPVTNEVVVTITENSGEFVYDKTEKEVKGYTVKEISDPLYKDTYFTFSGNDSVKGTYIGTYDMELKAEDFTNISKNFALVVFVIEDGKLTITGDPVIPEKTTPEADGIYQLGDWIPFIISVQNVTDGELTDITVADPTAQIVAGDGYTLVNGVAVIAKLDSGATVIVNAQHQVTEADILNGTYGNTATVTVDDKKFYPSAKTEQLDKPDGRLTVTKETTSEPANGATYGLGETITYQITVKNEGNVTISGIVVTDELTGDEWEIESLEPGETSTAFTAAHEVTEADILKGEVVNVATATGKTPEDKNPEVKPGEDREPTVTPESSMTVNKTLTNLPAKGYFTLGETAEFDITVTNDGNTTLTNVVVTDELAGAVVAQGDGYRANGAEAVIDVLEPGAEVLIKATYTVTENDLGQQLANSVTVKGEGPDDPTDPDENHDPEDATDEEEIPTDEAMTLNGAKTWIDDDNALQTRPESITLRLMADGEAYAETQATAESNWTYTFTGLPMHTAQGEEIVYTLTEDAVPGYDTEYAENSYDVTNTLQNYTLTINYWYDAVGGAVAADTVTRTLAYGEAYDVLSPVLEGCTADLLRVEGVMEGDVEFNVVYTREAFILTINYVFRGGAMAAPSYTATLLFGEAFNQNSPEVAGFVASQRNINGTMAGHNMVYTVIYVPGETTVVINEYGVPLGIGNVEMNVGDCFE